MNQTPGLPTGSRESATIHHSNDGAVLCMQFIRRAIRILDEKFEEVIGVVMLATVVSLIFFGVVMRVGFRSGIPWQEELSRILYVLVVYLGASYGIKCNDHIRITILVNLLPPAGRRILGHITDLIWVAFNLTIVIISMSVYDRMQRFLGESGVLYIPLHYIFLIVPIGFALLTLRMVQVKVQEFRGWRNGADQAAAGASDTLVPPRDGG